MKTTVIIPNYKGKEYIGACLESLYACEKETAFTVLVVDNYSNDGSLEIIQRDYPKTQVIALPENTGFCHAVNVGIEAAQTPYVLLLNNDTVVKPGFVSALERAMEASEKIFSVSSRMLMMQDESRIDDAGDMMNILGYAHARGKGKPAEQFGKPARIFSACGGAAMYRREIVLELGGFDEAHFAYLEDVDLGYRAMIHGYENYYEPQAMVVHAGSAVSGSRHNAFKVNLSSTNAAYMIGKNMPLLQILFNFPFLFAGVLVKTVFFLLKGMGFLYLQGYLKGIGRCFTAEGRKKKVPYSVKNSGNYFRIQMMLWRDFLGIFIKS